ncbi:Maleylacetoacetate isomerase-like protein [Aphelenchoides fujianensis]|nr:Maleylacetoacetate isomerase-like protein [Aphelenchoides fujianensis]
MASTPVLYSYWRSSCSWRVRIALELKGIKYEYKAVNLVTGEQRKEDQSLAIIEYLDEVFPDSPRLIGGSAAQKALIRSMALMNLAVIKHYGGSDEKKRNEWAAHFIQRGFEALERKDARDGRQAFQKADAKNQPDATE